MQKVNKHAGSGMIEPAVRACLQAIKSPTGMFEIKAPVGEDLLLTIPLRFVACLVETQGLWRDTLALGKRGQSHELPPWGTMCSGWSIGSSRKHFSSNALPSLGGAYTMAQRLAPNAAPRLCPDRGGDPGASAARARRAH